MIAAERMQWTALVLGGIALGLAVLQWRGLAPFYLALGLAALVVGIMADGRAGKLNSTLVLPARIGIVTALPAIFGGYIIMIAG